MNFDVTEGCIGISHSLRGRPIFLSRFADLSQKVKRVDARTVAIREVNVVRVVADWMHDVNVQRSGLGGRQHVQLVRRGRGLGIDPLLIAVSTMTTLAKCAVRNLMPHIVAPHDHDAAVFGLRSF